MSFVKTIVRGVLPAALLMLLPVTLQAQSVDIQEMQGLVERWVRLEQQETALVTDWQQQKLVLEQRLQILEEEEAQLSGIVASNTSDTDDITERRRELLETQNAMESDQETMTQSLQFAMAAINNLHGQLPPPLVEAWQARRDTLAGQLADDPDNRSNLQLQAVLDMLNQLRDFQERINLNEDTITTADGTQVLVTQLYLGLSHAWYVSADGALAGYGQSRPDGWAWLDSPAVDPATVQQAIAMVERNVDVRLVELPLVLQDPPDLPTTPAPADNGGAQ